MLVTARRRRGATAAESAIVLTVFLFLVLGAIDLGNAIQRQAAVCAAARRGARTAAVHGPLARPDWHGGMWGPEAVPPTSLAETPTGTAAHLLNAVRPVLAGCPPAVTRVRADWPDMGSAAGSQVQVTVTSSYTPLITYLFGGAAIPLSASSAMPISH